MITITSAQPDDAVGIGRLQKITWRATYPNADYGVTKADIMTKTEDWDSPEHIAGIRQRIAEPPAGTLRLVAKDGQQVVGHCIVSRGETRNRLNLIYILPEYQGQGIGKKLLAKAFDWLGHDKDITLEVVKYNDHTIGFYKQLGFEIVGDAHNAVAELPSGAVLPEYEMVLKA